MKVIDKIVKFLKENYKLIIPISLMIVIFIAFIVYYKISILDNYREYKEENVYQYFYGKRYDYKAKIGVNRKKEIVELSTTDYDITFDSTPIYYKNKDVVVFPSNMSVVMPTLNCSEYLASKYSSITKLKDNYILKTQKYASKLGRYFLYDGKDLYFFLDEVKISVGNKEITLSPMSYVVATSTTLSYYDKKTDTYKTISDLNGDSVAEGEYYKINLTTDQIDYYGDEVILTSKIDELNTIDMKGDK